VFGAHGFARAAGRQIFHALAAAGGQPQLLFESQGKQLTGAFSDAMAELVSGVCVVTAAGRDGAPYGLLATSLCSYSADPPTVLVCVGRHGRARSAVASAPAFGVHVLCDEHEDVAHRFATNGSDRFTALDWSWDDGVPALARDHVVAYLRCARVAVKRHGDHAIVIGRVEHVETAPGEPLVCLRRRMDWRLQSRSW
jgi:flavin reductase (DIM6/NTAB) family NADH-FMN oxidoreductase RutF